MRIYLIRHGHRADARADYNGGANPPLSEEGFEQAEHVADFICGEQPDALYSSSHLRALQTAAPLHARLGGVWNVWPVFGETNKSSWGELLTGEPDRAAATAAWRTGEMLPTPSAREVDAMEGNRYLLSSLAEWYPGIVLSQPFEWPDDWWRALKGETRETGYARIDLGIQALRNRHATEDRIALVAHGNCGDLMLSSIMNFPPGVDRRFSFDTGSVSRIDISEDGQARIAYLNRVEHLPPALRMG